MIDDFEQAYTQLIKIYTELGYPQELIGQWTLPRQDAQTLLKILHRYCPHNILEVGTFVGVTTLLIALTSPEETRIHSIDPNFPLKLEMSSMRSELYDFDTSIRAQDLALKAARKLGVDQKITFHEGGFSTINTFASYNTSPASQIAIVGPEVCASHGPFDFIFVDGLHYEADVYADLFLAAQHLTPTGSMAIHDVLGRWGSNVRRAVFRFLEGHPEYHFSHDHYAKIYESIGLLQRHNQDDKVHYQPMDPAIKDGSLFQARLLDNLAAVLVNMFCPASVVQVGGEPGVLERMQDLGVARLCGYFPPSQASQGRSFPVKLFPPDKEDHTGQRYDLCLCWEVFDELSDDSLDDLIQTCVDLSDTIILAASPPGEMGNYQKNNQPLAYWVSKFFEKGYLFADIIRPVLEPHVEATYAGSQQNSSYLLNLYQVKKEPALAGESINKDKLKELLIGKERRIEDLQLQNLYQRCILDYERKFSREVNQKYQETYNICQNLLDDNRVLNRQMEVINIFNRKVMHNTIKRAKELIHKCISSVSGKG